MCIYAKEAWVCHGHVFVDLQCHAPGTPGGQKLENLNCKILTFDLDWNTAHHVGARATLVHILYPKPPICLSEVYSYECSK